MVDFGPQLFPPVQDKMGEPTDVSKYAAEFIGTFMLVLTVNFVIVTGANVWGVTAIAVILMVMIYATAKISGANLNPAVSFALFVLGKLPSSTAVVYIVVQVVGGGCATVVAGCFFGFDKLSGAGVGSGFELYQALLAEFFYTFMLVSMVLNNAVAKTTDFYGLTIGFTVIAGGYGAGSISGGCFNPAVAIGLGGEFVTIGAYVVTELVAAFAAVHIYKMVRPEEPKGDMHNYLSEFLGTFFLNLTVGTAVCSGTTAAVWAISIALGNWIFALGDVSGAHFNPAVTVAILFRGAIDTTKASMYIVSQLCGSIAAAFITHVMFSGHQTSMFYFHSHGNYTHHQAYIAEVIATFTLSYVVLSVATTATPVIKEYFGFVIGSCVFTGATAIGSISGGSLNPSVTIGFSLVYEMLHGRSAITQWALYVVSELAGGILAAVIFRYLTHSSEMSLSGREHSSVSVAPLLDA